MTRTQTFRTKQGILAFKSFQGIGNFIYFLLVFFAFSAITFAEGKKEKNLSRERIPVSFEEISLAVQKHSFQIMSLEKEVASADSGKERTARHWHPRLYLDARAYNTNDPAVNFFSVLGQRSASQSDFSTASNRNQIGNYLDSNNQPYTAINSNSLNLLAPDNLNYPGSNTFQRGTLGMDLPLYEGSAKSNLSQSYELISQGKNLEKKSVILSEYSSSASLYAQLIILENYVKDIQYIKSQLQSILNSYQVGARNNPVGYSGLLGMKSLKNRLEGLELETATRIDSIHEYLFAVSEEINSDWRIIPEPVDGFLDKHLPKSKSQDEGSFLQSTLSYQARAMQLYAESSGKMAEMEKAKFLPKIGLYGESNLYSGSRNTATAYNVGFYVQMNLYNAEDIGAYKEAQLKSESQKDKANHLIREQKIKKQELSQRESVLEKQISLLEESSKLMNEQVINSRKLFVNGSINAMQLAEVFARYTDLTLSRANANREYILVRSEIFTLRNGGE